MFKKERGIQGRSSTTTNVACATAATAATITVNEQLTTAESAVAQAASHLELMREIVNKACVVADKALRVQTTPHETLAATCQDYKAAINIVDAAIADKAQ